MKSAYRRLYINARMALQLGVQLTMDDKKYILLSLQLPFGGSPCPSEFYLVSETITDVMNDLLACED